MAYLPTLRWKRRVFLKQAKLVPAIESGNVFAAHHRAEPSPKLKRVLCIGNIGTLGEALIARLISAPGYKDVVTATKFPMQSTTSRLTFCAFDALHQAAAWPDVDDVVILADGKPSYFKRDDVFPVVAESQVAALAKIAVAAGVKRLLVIAPTEAWQAYSANGFTHLGELERELRALPIADLIVVRPSEQSGHQPEKSRRGFLQRVADGMMGALGQYMIPQRFQPLRGHVVAEAAVDWLVTLPSGQHFLNAEHLYEWRAKKYPQQYTPTVKL